MIGKRIITRIINYEQTVMECLPVFFDAHKFIIHNKFRRYLLISGLVFLIFFSLIIQGALYGVNAIQEPISNWALPYLDQFLTFKKEEIEKGLSAVFWLIKKAIESNKDAIFSVIFMVIGTPFFSFISSKTEEIVSGTKYTFQLRTFLKEIKRGVVLSIRNSIKQVGLIIVISLIAMIPLVGIIAPLLTFIVQAYFNGLLMTDYTLERQGYSVKESQTYFKQHKPELFSIGLGFMFLLLIPVIGWFLAPTYALVAAYLNFEKRKI